VSAVPRSALTPATRLQQRPGSRRRSWLCALAGMCLVALLAGWPAIPTSAATPPVTCGSTSAVPATVPAVSAPEAPTLLPATARDAEVILSWNPPAQSPNGLTLVGYGIYQSTDSNSQFPSLVGSCLAPATSGTVTGLLNGRTYYFTVRAAFGPTAKTATTLGPPSNVVSATVGALTLLPPTAGNAQVTLSWSPLQGKSLPMVGYDIYQSTSPGGEATSPVNISPVPVQDTSYIVKPLANDETYYFVVRVVFGSTSAAGSILGPPSNEVQALPQGPLGAPTLLHATAGNGEVALSWSPPAPDGPTVAGYDIYDGTSPGGESASPVNISPVPGTSYTVKPLANGKTYYFVVKAVATFPGPPSNELSAIPRKLRSPPSPPSPSPSHPSGWHIRHALPPPSRSVFALPKVLESLALGALLVLLVGFPADLFNSTYEENEETIQHWLSRLTRRKARKNRAVPRTWAALAFFAVATALTTLVDPTFDFGWTGATVFAGFAVAIPLTMAAYACPAEWYQRRASKITGRFRVIFLALLIAAVLTAMSRLVHFNPGYVYGLIAGFTAKQEPSRSQKAKSVLAGAACVFALSVVAWIVWGKYDAVAQNSDASHAEAIIGAVVAQLAIMGITTVVFGLMPFKFMAGYQLRTWNRTIWIGVYTVAASWFALVLIRSNPDVLQNHNPPVAFAEPLILFLVFGFLSVLFWFYFARRPSPEKPAEDRPTPQAVPPGTSPDLTRPAR
jgi:Fibronectin type III domain